NTELFKKETIKQFIESFEILLRGIIEDANHLLYQLPLLTPVQQEKLLRQLTGKTRKLPEKATIIDDFVAQVKLTPNAPALIAGKISLSYQELNEKVNRLTHYLQQEYQLGVGKVIGVMLQRDHNLII
ncbi:MAG: AMP-binding protein, partial [Microcystis panniformis]